MPSLEDAEKSLSRCRKVSSGDTIMPDDINCLVDTANNTLSAVSNILKLLRTADPIEYVMDRYEKYHYDKTGALYWLQYYYYKTDAGVVILDGVDADEVEINMRFAGMNYCTSGTRFGGISFLKRNENKFIDVYYVPSRTVKVSNPDLILITKTDYGYLGIGEGDITKIRNIIELKFKKAGEVVKDYQVDVVSAYCTDNYKPYDLSPRGLLCDITPRCPDLFGFIELFHTYESPIDACLSALDSTDIDNAGVIYSRCFNSQYPYMYIPKGTKMLRFFTLSALGLFTRLFYYDPALTVLPDPTLKPKDEATDLFC